jgi:hypothetical protein
MGRGTKCECSQTVLSSRETVFWDEFDATAPRLTSRSSRGRLLEERSTLTEGISRADICVSVLRYHQLHALALRTLACQLLGRHLSTAQIFLPETTCWKVKLKLSSADEV